MYMVPSADLNGALEELLMNTVSDDTRAIRAKDAYDATVAESGALTKEGKRIAQIYLALRNPLRRGVGLGFREGFFPKDHANLQAFSAFVQSLLA